MSDRATQLAPDANAKSDETTLADARQLLSRNGIECRSLAWLSPPLAAKRGRSTLRVVAPDGARLKVRCLENEAEATRLAALNAAAKLAMLPVVEQRGSLLLEEWVDGEALTPEAATHRAEEVGALLGRLHAVSLPGAECRIDTSPHRQRAEEHLEQLGARGFLAEDAVTRLLEMVAREAPRDAAAALVHHDFAPDNIVVDRHGDLHLIDTEWLDWSAAGADLGRTAALWPMDARVWQRFLDGYRSRSPHAPRALRFWRIALAARTASIRRDAAPEARADVLAALRRHAQDGVDA